MREFAQEIGLKEVSISRWLKGRFDSRHISEAIEPKIQELLKREKAKAA